jgi:hypothetical protein
MRREPIHTSNREAFARMRGRGGTTRATEHTDRVPRSHGRECRALPAAPSRRTPRTGATTCRLACHGKDGPTAGRRGRPTC